jgi:small redox-active disulfide protein 2
MEIKVLGPGCAKCAKTEKLVQEVLKENNIDADVEKVTDIMQIAAYGVMATPSIVIDKDVVCAGKVPKKDEIKKWLGL